MLQTAFPTLKTFKEVSKTSVGYFWTYLQRFVTDFSKTC